MNHHRRSAQVWHVFSGDFAVLPAHPHVHPQSEWAIPASAFPATDGTHLPTPEGWKANLGRPWCEVAQAEIRTCNLPVANPAAAPLVSDPGQVVHMHGPLSPSSIIWQLWWCSAAGRMPGWEGNNAFSSTKIKKGLRWKWMNNYYRRDDDDDDDDKNSTTRMHGN